MRYAPEAALRKGIAHIEVLDESVVPSLRCERAIACIVGNNRPHPA